LIEALLLKIGGSVTGAVVRLWLQNSEVAQAAAADLDALVCRFAASGRERRTLTRELERISEQVAERLEPFFETEFGGLAENEKAAAGLAVAEMLGEAPLSDELLFATDLDPQALEAEIRGTHPDAAQQAFLSEAGNAFFDRLLREVSNYVVEIRINLPDFGSEAARVTLRRETELIQLVKTVLDRLPAQGLGLDGGEAAAFDQQYRRDVARKLDQLELFGISSAESRSRYSLTVAYLTLTASARVEDRGEEGEGQVSLPVDAALGSRRRVLVRAEAGLGKTTLLQWLAVNSARRSFRDELADWNDSVPFLLILRRFVDRDLPSIAEFTLAINQHARPPEGWVREQLRNGSALVLVDGVDELPEEKREAAREWLADLVAAYPEARYVATSRPPAVSEDWLGEAEFEPVALEPMSVPAISIFIDHWHEAVAETLSTEEEGEELARLALSLTDRVRERRAIRNLASTPLLCAMLCALNRERRAEIPSERIELYRIALEMLLERRDAERRVRADIPDLGRREKEILLRVFALWLLNNSRSDAAIEDLVNLVDDRLPGMPRVKASAEEVTENLLLRSGLLRQPVEGRVDFIHRTFQEYLAAQQAVATRSEGMLLEHAHLDQWQEVVVLAAGLADLPLREGLVAGLIRRGNRERRSRHRLHLLAVGCLETSAELSPELTAWVNALLEKLIPPRSLTEAKAIASAGELAIERLGKYAEGAKAAEAAACVRALSLIGGESALVQLEKFGPDSRVTVARELLRGWQEFPAEEYARRVLSRSPLNYGRVRISSPAELEGAAALFKASVLICSGAGETATAAVDWPWRALAGHPALREVAVADMQGLAEPPPLGGIPKLSTMRLILLPDLERIAPGNLPDLERLSLSNLPRLLEVPGIADLGRLRLLRLHNTPELSGLPPLPTSLERAVLSEPGAGLRDLTAFERCSSLEVLSLSHCAGLEKIDTLRALPQLTALRLDDLSLLQDISPIASARQLEVLALRGVGNLDQVSCLESCPELDELAVEGSTEVTDVSWLRPLTKLEVLSLTGCSELQDLPPLELPALSQLFLSGTGISDLGQLSGLPNLDALHLSNCRRITDLGSLAELRGLKRLSIANCDQIADVSVLRQLRHLHWLDARGCSPDLDLDFLEEEQGVLVRTGPPARAFRRAGIGDGWRWTLE
jgi:Leucine-rich repeat (LRR) protein